MNKLFEFIYINKYTYFRISKCLDWNVSINVSSAFTLTGCSIYGTQICLVKTVSTLEERL